MIEAVGTSTTAFVGVTRRGPADDTPRLLTSFPEFERAYGGLNDLAFEPAVNYVAHAAQAFFSEGGKRLYITRVVAASAAIATTADLMPGKSCTFRADFSGDAGNGRITLSVGAKPIARGAVSGVPDGSLVRINRPRPDYALKRGRTWRDAANLSRSRRLSAVTVPMDLLTLNVTAKDKDGFTMAFEGLGFDPRHSHYVGAVLSAKAAQNDGSQALWFRLELGSDVTALDLLKLSMPNREEAGKEFPVGSGPGAQAGTDAVPSLDDWKAALARLESIEEIAILAAPGHTEFPAIAEMVTAELVNHVSAPGAYRFAVLDMPRGSTVQEAVACKARMNSRSAALYYPWVVTAHPASGGAGSREITLPSSGFVCGIYARVDTERGVHKAPADEGVRGALRFDRNVTKDEQEILNPAGVNCLRSLPGRGHRVWGARTTSSDPEWKYINVRRYFIYLEHSIDRGTRWTVFEPNGEALWMAVRRVIEDFLLNEWKSGALPGDKPEKAFFVKCDRSTMTQSDLDQGRLICLIGVAVVKPAEFVIFRIGQWTAEACRP